MRNSISEKETIYEVYPIGFVRRDDNRTYLEISPEYRSALQELNSFSHAQILWWFSKFNDVMYREIMQIDPPYEAPKLGVFASKSPLRPNPIALTTVKINNIDTDKGIIEIPKIDAYNDSPILDIKAYIPCCDRVRILKVPNWASSWSEWMEEDGLGLE